MKTDHNKVFSPFVKRISIRILISLVVQKDLELDQLNVKMTFLHGYLNETIYRKQPQGYVKKGEEDLVCPLNKSIYDLK